jgi:hypothetical protein
VDTDAKNLREANWDNWTGNIGGTVEVNDDTADEDPDSVLDAEVGGAGAAVDYVDIRADIGTGNETDTDATPDADLETIADNPETADANTKANVGENADDSSTVPDTTL